MPHVGTDKETGSERLLAAACALQAERSPVTITTRLLAKRAGVHHTLANYTHGGVAALLTAAFRREQTKFAVALPRMFAESAGALPLSLYQNYWRAYIYRALDGSVPNDGAAGDPIVMQAVDALGDRFPERDRSTHVALAIAWWCLQVGALVFDRPLRLGLAIEPFDHGAVQRMAAELLTRLVNQAPDPLPCGAFAAAPVSAERPGAATGRKAAEARLVHAAIELLKERAEQGVSGRALAQRAEVNYGLIHHYFGSKEAVFDAAFVQLHEAYVADMVAADTQRLAAPFSMRSHEPFLRIWAYRELADIATPPIDLKGMRLLLENILRRRNVDRRTGQDFAEAQARAYCSLALQLGWVVCRRDLQETVAADETDTLARLSAIARWFVAGDWR